MISKFLKNDYTILVLRVGLGLFFIYAAQSKIVNTSDFARNIRAYDILPDSLSMIPAIFLPWIELFCGVLLVSGIFTSSSALTAAGLMVLFTVNILIALLRGLDIDCGCGASISGIERVSWIKILENSILIVLLIVVSQKENFKFALDNKFGIKL